MVSACCLVRDPRPAHVPETRDPTDIQRDPSKLEPGREPAGTAVPVCVSTERPDDRSTGWATDFVSRHTRKVSEVLLTTVSTGLAGRGCWRT